MTFEDLQQQWKMQDAKLDTMLRLNLQQIKASHFDAMRSSLGRVRRVVVVELLLAAAALLMLGSFNWDHRADPRYLVPGVILHLSAIALVGACVYQLYLLQSVDYGGPVVEAQRRLTELKRSRSRLSKWTLLVAPALWTPMLLAGLKGLLGVDGYAIFDRTWIVVNVVATLALIPLALWVARRLRPRHSALLQRLADDLAGRSVQEAAAFAEKLVRFEEEPRG